jgi:hypothetical protein
LRDSTKSDFFLAQPIVLAIKRKRPLLSLRLGLPKKQAAEAASFAKQEATETQEEVRPR